MKVTDLQAYLLSSPLPQPLEVITAAGLLRVYKQDCLLLRVHADQGLTGWAAGPASANLAQLINRNLKSAVVNTDPVKIDALRRKVFQRRPAFAGLAQAFGLIEVALLDLRGRLEGCPVSELLGGRVRQRLPLIASAGFYLPAERAAEEAQALAERGFETYRFRVGLGPEADAATVHSVREGLPEGCRMIVDARAWWQTGAPAYPPGDFEPWVTRVATHHLAWLAEPFHPEDRAAYGQLARKRWIPLMAGEHESDGQQWHSLADQGGVDLLLANLMLLGGPATGRELLARGAARGHRFILGGAVTPLEVLTLAQLGSCFSAGACEGIEWPCYLESGQTGMYRFSLGDELLKQPVCVENGALMLPATAGLGVEINPAVIQRYPWKSGPARTLG